MGVCQGLCILIGLQSSEAVSGRCVLDLSVMRV